MVKKIPTPKKIQGGKPLLKDKIKHHTNIIQLSYSLLGTGISLYRKRLINHRIINRRTQ